MNLDASHNQMFESKLRNAMQQLIIKEQESKLYQARAIRAEQERDELKQQTAQNSLQKGKTQMQKDTETADRFFLRNSTSYSQDANDLANFIRAEERKRFAEQCLGLFEGCECLDLPNGAKLQRMDRSATERFFQRLHELLTEAKP